MQKLDPSIIPSDGRLVILTVRDIGEDSQVMAADFRDTLALVYKPTGSYIGAGMFGIRLGKRPIEMVNGIWIMPENSDLLRVHTNVRLSPDMLSLEMIK